MTNTDSRPEEAAELRKRAEDVVREKGALSPENIESMSPAEIRRMVEDLRVHQIELEMQNEELRRAQAELEAARERYFSFYDLAPVGYATVSEKGMILEANLTTATLLGVAKSEVLKKPLSHSILKEDEDIYYLHINQLIKTATPQTWELRMVKANGTEFWVRLLATPVRDTNGEQELCIVLIDITDRKRAEEAAEKSDERYAMTLVAVDDGLWDWNIPSGKAFFSTAYYSILGYEDGEFPADYDTWRRIVHPDDIDSVEQVLQQSTQSGKVFSIDLRMKMKSGEWRWVCTRGKAVELDADGKTQRMVGTLSDITERKQAEGQLREISRRFHLAAASAKAGVWDWNLHTNEMIWDERMYELYGLTHDDFPGGIQAWERGLHSDDASRAIEECQAALRGERVFDTEFRINHPDGTVVYIKANGLVMRDEKGTPLRMIGLNIDISERKKAEEKIQNLLKEKELLLHEVHHRIKNNMNIMMSLLSLQADTVAGSPAEITLRDAGNRVRSMHVLYDKLYRSDNFGQISVKIYLTHLLDQIVDTFPNRDLITMDKQIDDFVLDASKLTPLGIIVNELLTNIMKYAFAGKNGGLITVSASLKDKHATVVVQDDGVGIPDSVDIGSSGGFGLQLVGMCTQQLEGTIRIERVNGTKCVLEFEV
jgi:PAS domain S-box-containing protein